ncbi:hypothetical protein EVAR_98003_1 [Eumeta japonica]|uniref:Uncharacterized protein n=1 Tax=Eumeta variegata TaxID=151549 RepID=A0A4C1WLJ7_EUMVA|nr:hypothetical protein EVAR_98003_1 [Eumeta japonica]
MAADFELFPHITHSIGCLEDERVDRRRNSADRSTAAQLFFSSRREECDVVYKYAKRPDPVLEFPLLDYDQQYAYADTDTDTDAAADADSDIDIDIDMDIDIDIEFKRGRVNLSGEFCDGRPSTAANSKNVVAIRCVIETDSHVTYHEFRPCDFFVFTKIMNQLRGQRFSSPEKAVEEYEKYVSELASFRPRFCPRETWKGLIHCAVDHDPEPYSAFDFNSSGCLDSGLCFDLDADSDFGSDPRPGSESI